MKLGIERIRRLAKLGRVSRRLARRLLRDLLLLLRERRAGRELSWWRFDELDRLRARMLAGELEEAAALLSWQRRTLWGPALFGLMPPAMLWADGRRPSWNSLPFLASGVVGGFLLYGLVGRPMLRRTGEWIRSLE